MTPENIIVLSVASVVALALIAMVFYMLVFIKQERAHNKLIRKIKDRK